MYSKRINIFYIPYGGVPVGVLTGTPPKGGIECKGYEKSWFSTNISFYLRNDTRYSHNYHGRRIGNRTQALEWCHFQWPWRLERPQTQSSRSRLYLTLKISETVRHTDIVITRDLRPSQECHFEWHWLTLSSLAKYLMTRSVARSLWQLSFLYLFCFQYLGFKPKILVSS